MAISKATLAAIQKTSTFAHNLKSALQAETKKYSDRLSKALSTNANGNAFELLDGPEITNWKSVGKLAKMVDAIEAELSSAFKFASDLVNGTPQVAAKGPQVTAAQAKAAPAKKAAPTAGVKVSVGRGGANAEKLLAQLSSTLSSDEFTVLKPTALAKTTSIPLGSMTATLKKLTETGDLVLGKNGGYKLGKKKAAPAAKAAAAVKPAKTAAKSAAKSPALKATAAVTTEAVAPKVTTKTKAVKSASVAKKVATKAATTKTAAAVVSQPKKTKPVVATAKPLPKAATKKAPTKKATPTALPAEAAAPNTDAAAEAAGQDTAVVTAS